MGWENGFFLSEEKHTDFVILGCRKKEGERKMLFLDLGKVAAMDMEVNMK